MEKQSRGYCYSLVDSSSNLLLCSWHDNNVVCVASNCDSVEPQNEAKRWSAKERKSIHVLQPNVLRTYNTYMGGVDQLDQILLFIEFPSENADGGGQFSRGYSVRQLTMLSSWTGFTVRVLLMTNYLSFVHLFWDTLLHAKQVGPFLKFLVLENVSVCLNQWKLMQQDIIWRESIEKQRKCKQCHKKVQKLCVKCNVPFGLHIDCFPLFHM